MLVVGVAGGSGSGKTTVARRLRAALPLTQVRAIQHDSYYRDHPELDDEARAALNYDHPDALETELLVAHLEALRAGREIEVPRYDFRHHRRARETEHIAPAPVIVVEGILVLAEPRLRPLLDLKLYVDTDADIRVLRRVRRDMELRGRSFEEVRLQYYETVRPMHLAFVEPSKRHADLILPEGGDNEVALSVVVARLREAL